MKRVRSISVVVVMQNTEPSTTACGSETLPHAASSLVGLDWLNFFLADVQTGVGPFLAIYLAGYKWNEQSVGIAMTVGSMAGILTQSPAGGLVDRLKAKRLLIAVGVIALAVGAIVIALRPTFWPVLIAQVLIGGTSSIFGPCVCAIALGIVGRQAFDRRQGRNQTFNSAGNVAAAAAMGLLGYFVSNRSIFWFVAASTLPAFICLELIRPGDINHDWARGSSDGGDHGDDGKNANKPSRLLELLKDKPLAIFLLCAVLFHFANAAMLPLLGEMLARGKGRTSMLFMTGCVATTQVVITCIAAWTGRTASTWGRKPLLLIAFGALPIRGVLYTLTHSVALLIAIQLLDGVAAGIFGVVSILVIADLTRGTGRFNLTQGLIATAVGIGASLSQTVAGAIVKHVGYNMGFTFLAIVAAVALIIFWSLMPETRDRSQQH
jgi:predicted MFS family arabinose efflux permease